MPGRPWCSSGHGSLDKSPSYCKGVCARKSTLTAQQAAAWGSKWEGQEEATTQPVGPAIPTSVSHFLILSHFLLGMALSLNNSCLDYYMVMSHDIVTLDLDLRTEQGTERR